MIVLDHTSLESITDSWSLELYGLGLVSIAKKSTKTIYLKGMNDSMLNSLIRAYKKKIQERREGKIIDLIGSYTVYIHFFDLDSEILTIFYLNLKDIHTQYDDLCAFSAKILSIYRSNYSQVKINSICKEVVSSLPKLSALYIISRDGHCLFSKTSERNEHLRQNAIQISGFISAILMFSEEVIGKMSNGEQLKTINFENIQFYVKKKKVIFAYLIESDKNSEVINKFADIIAEDFLHKYSTHLENFDGNVRIFHEFESSVDKYFCI